MFYDTKRLNYSYKNIDMVQINNEFQIYTIIHLDSN